MHSLIAWVDKTSAFELRKYFLRFGTTSGRELFPADKVIKRLSACAAISLWENEQLSFYLPRIAPSPRFQA